MKNNINRRSFVKTMAVGGLGLGITTSAKPFNILPAYPVRDKYKVAVIGVNGRGSQHAQGFALQANAEVAYVCDVDQRAVEKGIDIVVKAGQKNKPKGVGDFRKALDDKTVDAISIAAPDHWHAPAAILGLKAGKHVYVEKPGSQNAAEGELLTQAALKYGKSVQMGNQRRSWPRVREAMEALHNGVIGRVYYARTWYTNTRPTIGTGKEAPVPSWLDYDLWQGPAPRKPFKDNVIHYNWHWFWQWGTGEVCNNGTHYIDVARWGLNVNYPTKVYSTGGRYQFKDDWQTPDTQVATFDFDGGKTIAWEGRSCNARSINGMGNGISFHGENGTLEVIDNSYKIFDNKDKLVKHVEPASSVVITQQGPGFDMDKDHFANFINTIGQTDQLHSPYPEINKSVLLCHLANISYRTGRALRCDPTSGRILNDEDAMKHWSREYEKGWEPTL
jgi:predicted dehydrogenase